MSLEADVARAVSVIREADALLVTAGAGIGVDSGLPDFRGDEGFWNAYPPFRELGLSFVDLANPTWFERDPARAWGFYGHRLELYRRTKPHDGFALLQALAARMSRGHFVFTSNVDGAFQRAGFDEARIVECHGALDYVQCLGDCGVGILRADELSIFVEVDPTTFRAQEPLPRCPRCRALFRPNVLMFGDGAWDGARSEAQEARFSAFLASVLPDPASLVVIECGAGTAIPTVRRLGDRLAARGATLVRINVREPEVPVGSLGLPLGALEALTRLLG